MQNSSSDGVSADAELTSGPARARRHAPLQGDLGLQLAVAWILPVVSRCRKSLAVPLERRELLQIYASFNEKRLSAEWIWAATRQVEGREVTQRSAVVAERWLLPSAESQLFIFFFPPPPRPVSFFSSWVSGCVVCPAEKGTEKRNALLMEEAMPCGLAWVLILSKELEGGARPPSSASSTLLPLPVKFQVLPCGMCWGGPASTCGYDSVLPVPAG